MKKVVSFFSVAMACILTLALTSCAFVITDGNGHTAAGSTEDIGYWLEKYWYIILIALVVLAIIVVIVFATLKKNGKK